MISLRYHAVSIAAVFLALAVGVVLGSSGVSDRVLAAVSTQRDDLGAEVTRLTAERDALAAQERAAGEFASRVGPAAVRGLLAGQTVALVVAGADTADRDGVVGLIGQAGGTVTGLVELTDAVGDPARADQLRELTSQLLPVGAKLPAASDTGSLVGGLLGGVLLARDGQLSVSRDDADSVLTGLTSAGFVHPGDARARRTSCSCSRAGREAGWTPPTPRRCTPGWPRSSTSQAPARCSPGPAARLKATGAVGVARRPEVAGRPRP